MEIEEDVPTKIAKEGHHDDNDNEDEDDRIAILRNIKSSSSSTPSEDNNNGSQQQKQQEENDVQIEMSHLYNSSNKNSPHHNSSVSMTSIVNISVVIHNSKWATIFLILNTMIGSGILTNQVNCYSCFC